MQLRLPIMFLHRSSLLLLPILALAACATSITPAPRPVAPPPAVPSATPIAQAPRPVKVLIISMFKPEGDVWVAPLGLDQEIAVPGLSRIIPLCGAIKPTSAR